MNPDILSPLWLTVMIPASIVLFYIYIQNRVSLVWIEKNIHSRFRPKFTVLNGKSLILYFGFLFLLLLLGAAAASNPGMKDTEIIEKEGQGTLIIVLDASFSMMATDTVKNPTTKTVPVDRYDQAKDFANELVDRLPGWKFGLITFSGTAELELLPTNDLIAVKTAILHSKVHNFEHTGTSFLSAFRILQKLRSESSEPFQVVFLSDGEFPKGHEEVLDEDLDVLKVGSVPVHTVGIGTEKRGGSVNFFIVNYKSEKTVPKQGERQDDKSGTKEMKTVKETVTSISTYRSNVYLSQMSGKTGGKNLIVEKHDWPSSLVPEIQKLKKASKIKTRTEGRMSFSYAFLMIVFFLLLLEGTVLFSGNIRNNIKIFISSFRKGLPLLLLLNLFSCREFDPVTLAKADRYNEAGRTKTREGSQEEARLNYGKSALYGFRSYIPEYNTGVAYFRERDYDKAHEYFQKAVQEKPDFQEALYNDGISLYRLGQNELKEEICNLKRAETFFENALRRMKETADAGGRRKISENALDLGNFFESELEDLKKKGEEKCREKQDEKKEDSAEQEQNRDQENRTADNSSETNKGNDNQKSDSLNGDKDDENKSSSDQGKDDKNKSSANQGKDDKNKSSANQGKDDKNKSSADQGKDDKNKSSANQGKDDKNKSSANQGKDDKNKSSANQGKDDKNKSSSDQGKDDKNKSSADQGKDDRNKENSGTEQNKNTVSGITDEENRLIKKELERQDKNKDLKNTKYHKSRHQQNPKKNWGSTDELRESLRKTLW
ncbi:MAG TPA: VWA domain-containing protein [Leptospiraceae bacterium]|nr:VWA domain-containing protein [Leptospiraceae bacterium]